MRKTIAQYHFDDVIYSIDLIADGYIDPYDLSNIESLEILRNDDMVLSEAYLGQLIPSYEYIARHERNVEQFVHFKKKNPA